MPKLELISADEARRRLAGFGALGVETAAIDDADGRVLAEALIAGEDVPPLPRGVMDGYAVRAADTGAGAALRVVGAVPMGDVWPGQLGAGEAVQIATGGVVPRGADAVVRVEDTRPGAGGATVEVLARVAPGANVLGAGEDVARGETLVPAGRRLRPQDVAALAAFGVTRVAVHRRPRAAVLSTGSEIVPPGATPRPGQVRDQNQAALAAQAARAGAIVTRAGIVADDAAALEARVAELVAAHDLLILSGGSSIGARDLTADALAAIGAEIVFHGVDIRPGKPLLVARLGAKPIVGMPGVPTSAMIVFDVLIAPLVRRLGGELVDDARAWPSRRAARLARRVPSAAGREDYLRVRLVADPARAGEWLAEPIGGGPAALASVVRADGLVVVPAAAAELAERAPVDVLLYA